VPACSPLGGYALAVEPAPLLHIERHVGKLDGGSSSREPICPDEELHAVLLFGKGMLDPRPDLRLRCIPPGDWLLHRLAFWFLVMNAADLADLCQKRLIGG